MIQVLVATALASSAAWWLGSDEPRDASAELLPHRLWVDRMPTSERDIIEKLVIVQSIDHGSYGVSESSSVWRHRTEVFKWTLEGRRLRMIFPQDGARTSARVRTWDCEGEAPEGFELCLELRGKKRTVRLYSRRDWVLRPRPSGDLLDDGPLGQGLLPDAARVEQAVDAPAELDRLWAG